MCLPTHVFTNACVYQHMCLPTYVFTNAFVYQRMCLPTHVFTNTCVGKQKQKQKQKKVFWRVWKTRDNRPKNSFLIWKLNQNIEITRIHGQCGPMFEKGSRAWYFTEYCSVLCMRKWQVWEEHLNILEIINDNFYSLLMWRLVCDNWVLSKVLEWIFLKKWLSGMKLNKSIVGCNQANQKNILFRLFYYFMQSWARDNFYCRNRDNATTM